MLPVSRVLGRGGFFTGRRPESVRLDMAKRDSQSVGGVVGFGDAFQAQKALDHMLHLELVGRAETRQGHFYFPGVVLKNGQARFFQHIKDDPAGMAHAGRGAAVFSEIKLFHGGRRGLMGLDELPELMGKAVEAVHQGVAGRSEETTVADYVKPIGRNFFNQAPAGGRHAGVDT